MIGHIIIDQYQNNSIDERYNIQDLPTVLFFQNGDLQSPLVYKEKNFHNLLNDINKFTGLNRDAQGNLNNEAGIINEISQLIKNYYNSGDNELEIFDELEKLKLVLVLVLVVVVVMMMVMIMMMLLVIMKN